MRRYRYDSNDADSSVALVQPIKDRCDNQLMSNLLRFNNMNRILIALVLCLAVLSVQAQKREKVELVPLSFRGDVCDKVCNKRDGWERCEKVTKRGQYEVTCTDLRGGSGGPGGKGGPKGPFGKGPFGRR
ncbi:unnamed protein product [Strongylus vulgaris]|uniref:Uncharacterized protein n=1 Tax=Strongylus vulgaris TaxID=40348 RepID=A0A3P7J0N7_STRVU|nr:unnamed protein product [Strongylus vulgaris]